MSIQEGTKSIITKPNDTLKLPPQLSEAEQKYQNFILDQIKILTQNKIPKNHKGDYLTKLSFNIENYELLDQLLDALIVNKTFKGELYLKSTKFDDKMGYKLSIIIANDTLSFLKVENQSFPFTDKICLKIGDALKNNKNLKSLDMFLNIDNFSPEHLVQFLVNPNSNLERLSFLKLNKKFFHTFANYMNKESKLNIVGFYFEPLKFHDLLYEPFIPEDLYSQFADRIQNDSNIINIEVIPIIGNFDPEINDRLIEDIEKMQETLMFSCKINSKKLGEKSQIHSIFNTQNAIMNKIIENLNNIEDKKIKNSIISVRSYLNRTIGELLNNALYELEIKRERNPENKELFTAKGSIRFISDFLQNPKI